MAGLIGTAVNSFNSFWNDLVWLSSFTQKSAPVAPSLKTQYADYQPLLYPLPIALIILALGYVFERYVFKPIGTFMGVKNNKPKEAPPNPVLEEAYNNSKQWKYKQILSFAKQLDMTEKEVEKWLELREAQDKPTTLTKYCESSWRCLHFTANFIYGVAVLRSKPWLWDINQCWNGFPNQPVTSDIWWYYMVSMAFYWSLTMNQFFNVKRRDFWQVLIYHMVTIALLGVSWAAHMVRIGSLVMVLHDCANIFLEASNVARYSGHNKVCNTIVAILTVLGTITRLGVYPFWILKNTTIDAPKTALPFSTYYIFNSLLYLLLVLHCFWTYLIWKAVAKSFQTDNMEGDMRSSSEDSED